MIVLGIETSCDETACAITSGNDMLSNIVSSSVHLHKIYGGVVPEIASRFHLEYLYKVVTDALKQSKKTLKDVDLIAVTYGPGLSGSLLTGISFAKTLSYALNKPLIGVNHILAHLFSNFINKRLNAIGSSLFIFIPYNSVYSIPNFVESSLIFQFPKGL